jgi:AcrR family transcriptional regulator
MTAATTPPSAVDAFHGSSNGAAEPETDGRRLRRDRNRTAVVDALLVLYKEGNLHPSSAEIAERAGLSPRSLFRYFDDVDDLCRTAVDRQLELARPLLALDITTNAPLDERITALASQRLRLFEAVAPAATVLRLAAPFQPPLREQLAQSRALLRSQVAHILAPELAALDGGRRGLLATADVLCSFETHQLLRNVQHLSKEETVSVLVGALRALFAAPVPAA